MLRIIFAIYQWLIAFPILLGVTITICILTSILSPLLPNTNLSYFPARAWGRLMCWLLFIRVDIKGLEHIKEGQSYVFVCNHQNVYDIFVVYGWMPLFFKWLMKKELRRLPFVGKASEAAGHIFVDRSNPRAAQKSLEIAQQRLQNGVSLVVFPEGTRTSDGSIGKFKRGAFQIASELNLPIVPMTLNGAYERLRKGSYIVEPGLIELIIHAPITWEASDEAAQRAMMQQSREVIQQSSRRLPGWFSSRASR
ncbi:MAG: 1-acyl-sn-glycerol-3-phosphate acyltransferase [Paludibacteraceae bacterium]|nr:1-acyl-sn-glycerol-3-phosphate acyltransferase [Paludibacteraceae bacterium]